MRTHPVFLCLAGRRCIVVGGGTLAEEKARACLEAGGAVVVIASERTPGLNALAAEGRVAVLDRSYRTGDLAGAMIAYAETKDPVLARQLRDDAAAAHVLLNVVDVPEACDFFAPAVVRRDALCIAIGTGGRSPSLAAHLRRELAAQYGPEYAPYLRLLGAVRGRLGAEHDRRTIMGRLVESDLLQHVRTGDRVAIDRVLRDIAGASCALPLLDVALEEGA